MTELSDPRFKRKTVTIFKRDADCYDVTDNKGRIAALRSDFTESKAGRVAIPGTWRIRWEFTDGVPDGHYHTGRSINPPAAISDLTFDSVHEAFAYFCSQVLQ